MSDIDSDILANDLADMVCDDMDTIASLRSRLADAERERDGLRGALKGIVDDWSIEDFDAIYARLAILARPITITRISHPESNARPGELEPCPFCGKPGVDNSHWGGTPSEEWIELFGCKACGVWFDTPGEWNRRVSPAADAGEGGGDA